MKRNRWYCPAFLLESLLLAAPAAGQVSPAQEALALMQRGDYEKAEAVLSASSQDPFQMRLLLELASRRGRQEDADRLAEGLLHLYHTGRLQGAPQAGQAAYAARHLDRWEEANRIFIEASKTAGVSLSVFVDWGNLYLAKYNAAEAESIFLDALQAVEANAAFPRWKEDDVYVGLARALRDQGKPGSDEALNKALELNPENLDAVAEQVTLAIHEQDWEEATRWLERGLKVNRGYLPLLELKAAVHFFRNDPPQYQELRRQILQINPADARLFETLADLAVTQRRLEDSISFYREALQLDPRRWSALASLGINLLRMGEEEEGKRVLEQAYQNDPYNIWTVNTLRLVDSFDRFERFDTPHFSVKLHRKEAGALRPYVESLLEESLTTLENRYGHQVSGRYVFEMYPDHADFAVRTLGLPGLGALGATFGRVVAMDSPSARPEKEFHWGSTLWHEVAHVVTLSLSKNRVPRWLTEGLSMMEERQAREGWGDFLGPSFVQAFASDRLLPLAELNAGFVRPEFPGQLELSYFQAGWVCEFLASRYGFEKIRAMLVAFGEGLNEKEVFETVLGKSVEEVDREFRAEMEKTLRPLVPRLQRPEKLLEESAEPTLEQLQGACLQHPDNYFLNSLLGRRLLQAGRIEEAAHHLERAVELFPTLGGKDSPYALLADLYLKGGRTGEAIRILERWWRVAPRFPENAVQLARLLAAEGRREEAARYLQEAMFIDPLTPETHRLLGDLYLELDRPREAAAEFTILLGLDDVDPAQAHYDLARALHRAGDREGARRQVLLSLEIAPGYREAQKLLLEIVRQ